MNRITIYSFLLFALSGILSDAEETSVAIPGTTDASVVEGISGHSLPSESNSQAQSHSTESVTSAHRDLQFSDEASQVVTTDLSKVSDSAGSSERSVEASGESAESKTVSFNDNSVVSKNGQSLQSEVQTKSFVETEIPVAYSSRAPKFEAYTEAIDSNSDILTTTIKVNQGYHMSTITDDSHANSSARSSNVESVNSSALLTDTDRVVLPSNEKEMDRTSENRDDTEKEVDIVDNIATDAASDDYFNSSVLTKVQVSSFIPEVISSEYSPKELSVTSTTGGYLVHDSSEPLTRETLLQTASSKEHLKLASVAKVIEVSEPSYVGQNIPEHFLSNEERLDEDEVQPAIERKLSPISIAPQGVFSLNESTQGIRSDSTEHLDSFMPRIGYVVVTGNGLNVLSDAKENLGVTFDPNGMIHDGPQDPDSVTFTVKSNARESEEADHSVVIKPLNPEESIDAPEREIEVVPVVKQNESGVDKEWEAVMNSQEFISHLSHSTSRPNTDATASSNDTNEPSVAIVSSVPFDYSEEIMNDSPHVPLENQSNWHSSRVTTPTDHITTPFVKTDLVEQNFHETSTVGNRGDITSSPVAEIDYSSALSHAGNSELSRTEESAIRPIAIEVSNESVPHSTDSELLEMYSTTKDVKPQSLSVSTQHTIKVENQTLEPVSVLSSQEPETSSTVDSVVMVEPVNSTDVGNSSIISGVALKSSVSVSMPVSKVPNTTQQAAAGEQDASVTSEQNSVYSSTPSSAKTTVATKSTTRFRIRKPKLRIGNEESSEETERTRKPFTPALPKPTSTTGPPVSIFKKERTRRPSITSSTTAGPSTIRVHYASRGPPGILPELVFSLEPVTTTVPTTTTTEEPEEDYSDEPFTDQTEMPILANEDNVRLVKVGGYIVLEKGLRWNEQLRSRHSPAYKEKSELVHRHLEHLLRSSPIATRLWKIEIDGFSRFNRSRPVAVDFILYLIKSPENVAPEELVQVFHNKLKNGTFSRFRVDTTKTNFEVLYEEPLKKPTPPPEPEEMGEPPIPQWAIAVIVIGAASLIFVVLFATVTLYGRHHMRRRYSHKLSEDDSDQRPGEWESKMAAAYENLAADCIYDADDLRGDYPKKSYLVD